MLIYFNTSYVVIKQELVKQYSLIENNFNTSYVVIKLNRMFDKKHIN